MTSIFDSSRFNQNLFFPRPDPAGCPDNAEDFFVEAGEGVQVHIRIYPNPQSRFSLLYFHGNGEIASDYNDLAEVFHALGAELIIGEYRGYGKSSGIPTLRDALADARLIYTFLKDSGKLKPRVGVMGRSLGSASAIELCSTYPEIDCCVIESGYADPIPLVERRGLRIDRTTPEEDALFNNSHKIAGVRCPLLIMHGEEDVLIVPQEAKMNYDQAGSKEKFLQIFPGVGHNDILFAPEQAYFATLAAFFEQILGQD